MTNRIFQIDYCYKQNDIEIVFPQCNIKMLYNILIDLLMHDKYDITPSYGWESRIVDDDFYFEDWDQNSIFQFKRIAKHRFRIIINRELTAGWAMGCEDLSTDDVFAICTDIKMVITQLLFENPGVNVGVALFEIPMEYWEPKEFNSKEEFIDFQAKEQRRRRKHIARSTKFD